MRKYLGLLLCVLAVVLFGLADASIREPETGKSFDAQVEGSTSEINLICTGVGCRKKTALGVKVYAVAHWIDPKSAGTALLSWTGKSGSELADDQQFFDALCAADVEKSLQLVFVRNVSAKQIQEGFKDSLQIIYSEQLSPEAEKFLAVFTTDIKTGQTLELRSLPGHRIEVRQNNATIGSLPADPELARAVWAIYFHEKLADNHLEDVKPKLIQQFETVW